MKLYNANLSPYTSRVRIQIYAKGLDVDLVEPPGGIVPGGSTSDAYKELNPIGKIPSLDVDGEVIPESSVICEYLEDRFPTPALRPQDPGEAARMRTLARIVDLYMVPPFFALFGQLRAPQRDEALIEEKLAEASHAFDLIEHYLGKGPFAVGDALTVADCTLVPLMFFTRILPLLGAKPPIEARPKLAAWWDGIQKQAAPARVLAEMGEASKEAFGA